MNIPVSAELQAAFNRERLDAQAGILPDAGAVREKTVQMYERLDALQIDVIARRHLTMACVPGCSHCCHLRVEIRPHEAFVLAQHIRTNFSAAQQQHALQRIEETLERIAPLSPAQHIRAGIACALLEDGRCSVYEGRPATCRKYHSVSRTTCRDAFNDTAAPLTGEIEDEQVRLAGNAVALGYAKGTQGAGYDIALHELHFALHCALTDPCAEERHHAGEPSFPAPA